MAKLNIEKVTELPVLLKPSTIYFVRGDGSELMDVYVTGETISELRHTITRQEVIDLISGEVSGLGAPVFTATISFRDNLPLTSNTFVLVGDATEDPTVESGSALYFYESISDEFIKVAEYESMDIELEWDLIQGKPTSTPTVIDSAVSLAHSHSNKNILDKLSETPEGGLAYDGDPLAKHWDVEEW